MGPTAFVDTSALAKNLRLLMGAARGKAAFPVIKAQAYGHDAALVARALSAQFTVDEMPYFCVARSTELATLAPLGLPQKLLLLSEVDWDWHAQNSHLSSLAWALVSLGDLRRWTENRTRVSTLNHVHLKINTGMNRLGLREGDAREWMPKLKSAVREGLVVEGVMTHFWNSDASTPADTEAQAKSFSRVLKLLESEGLLSPTTWVHAENSAALRWQLPSDAKARWAFRPGIHLWGYGLDAEYRRTDKFSRLLSPAMAVGAPIRQIQTLAPDEGLSYGWRYRHTGSGSYRVATVPLGYADGIPRDFSWDGRGSAKGFLVVRGKLCPIISTVTMDMVMIKLDASIANAVNEETYAYWLHPKYQTAYDIAEQMRTISYEVLCRVSARVPRRAIAGEGELP
ncbi:MAG TPA: alanine racemase [Bdellovibrionota bacterium]|jgi:alanine racemase|nr:alanine racemase [Bdellovibrionota bacterium]